jgi:hypothetical protein
MQRVGAPPCCLAVPCCTQQRYVVVLTPNIDPVKHTALVCTDQALTGQIQTMLALAICLACSL